MASLAADGSYGYHFHDVAFTKAHFNDFLLRHVASMDDFKSMFAKAGKSPFSKVSILKDFEHSRWKSISSSLFI